MGDRQNKRRFASQCAEPRCQAPTDQVGKGKPCPPSAVNAKPHTSPTQISVLPSPTSTVFTRRCHPLAFTSVSPIFDQRRSRDPPADVPARLQENSGTTPPAPAVAC
jgi:hypothetical protein